MKPEQIRAKVLLEWRGLPEYPFPKDTARHISDSLTKVMHSLGLKDRLKEDEVLQAWKELVGDFIASHSSPQRLKDGVLYVRVLQPTVHFELDRVWKPQILEKFKKRFGSRVVREIRFRIG